MKRTASAVALAAALLLAPVAVAGTATADTYYANCKAAFAAGQSNIHRGEAGYRAPLDRDGDGVACEAGDPAAGNGGTGSTAQGVSASQPSTGDQASSPSTGDQAGSEVSTGSAGSSADQVAVVPEGGAETGDGSTERDTGWWIGGALLAGLGALVTARRARVTGRR
ncbi:excalibur calcium-binding domain-containing protein [Actinomycetospora sp.]|jgi:hypothetical protein|uniref:excalibur calcium-binding domain-containing protein n=1 Tax=Actinomycetospora sp. TaxID=1872135 RepID=UPI002F424A98